MVHCLPRAVIYTHARGNESRDRHVRGTMNTEARKRVRHVMLARHAVSPKLRGKYQRSLHAARLMREAHALPLPPSANEQANASPMPKARQLFPHPHRSRQVPTSLPP